MMRRALACLGLVGTVGVLGSCSDTDDSRWAEATNPAWSEFARDSLRSVGLGEQRATASLPAGLRAAAIQVAQAEAPAHYDFDEGAWLVKQRTAKDRLSRALHRVRQWCRAHRHDPLRAQQQALAQKLRGHYGYFRAPVRIGPPAPE